jgi:hypothetical protein
MPHLARAVLTSAATVNCDPYSVALAWYSFLRAHSVRRLASGGPYVSPFFVMGGDAMVGDCSPELPRVICSRLWNDPRVYVRYERNSTRILRASPSIAE